MSLTPPEVPAVSVVIPARDAAATLAETLDSVRAQRHAPLEVLLVDDGSTDNTAAIAVRHGAVTRIVPGAAKGPGPGMNLGARAARGQLLAFLDADDLWAPEWLGLGVESIHRTGADAAIGHVETFADPGMTQQEIERLQFKAGRSLGYLTGAFIVRRDAFLEAGGFDERFRTGFFIDFYDRFVRGAHRVETVADCVLYRRIRASSLSHRNSVGTGAAADPVARDFLAVAREAIRRRREQQARAKSEERGND